MAEAEHPFVRALGGRLGITFLASSLVCIISSFAAALYAHGERNGASEAEYTLSPNDRVQLFFLVCFSRIALVGAMLVEHTYMFIFIARPALSRLVRPSIRLTPFFWLILGCNWLFFALGQAFLAVAIKKIRHNSQLETTLVYACYLMIPVLLSTVLLHVKATGIWLSVSNIILVHRLPQSVVQAEEDIEECSICLDTPEMGDAIRHLPCQHTYHKMCIDQWLVKTPLCPLCKEAISDRQ